MNNKKFLIFFLIFSLSIFVIFLNIFKNESKTVINNTIVKEEDLIINKKNMDSLDKYIQIKYVEEPTDTINKFNSDLIDIVGYGDDSKAKELEKLSVKERSDSKDVLIKINEYLQNFESNQVQITGLILSCMRINQTLSGFEKAILADAKQLSELSFNEYYFNLGLKESKFCDNLKTRNDPFFVMLALARKGNLLSQFLLLETLEIATHRGLIDIYQYPLYYKNIRDEAVDYLRQLSAKGVTRASEKLIRLYAGTNLLPADKVLEYYYSYLTLKQEGIERVYVRDPIHIYNSLSDRQKAIVDRMIERIK